MPAHLRYLLLHDGPDLNIQDPLLNRNRYALCAGWKAIFIEACEKIDAILAENPLMGFQFRKLYESCAALKVETIFSGRIRRKAILSVLDELSARSSHTCQLCGDRGRLYKVFDKEVTMCRTHIHDALALYHQSYINGKHDFIRYKKLFQNNNALVVDLSQFDEITRCMINQFLDEQRAPRFFYDDFDVEHSYGYYVDRFFEAKHAKEEFVFRYECECLRAARTRAIDDDEALSL